MTNPNDEAPRICVFGAGAVGGYLATRLALAGTLHVSMIARRAHVEEIRRNGLRLLTGGGELVARPDFVAESADDLPPQNLVVVTLKAHALTAAAPAIASLLEGGGSALFVTNGVPWWWLHTSATTGRTLPLIDPEGVLWRSVRPDRALGCVVYSMNEVIAPGVIRHHGNNRWILGEPSNVLTSRLADAVRWLRSAGIEAEPSADLRLQVWIKLLKNATINPIAALTRLDTDRIAAEPALVEMVAVLAAEVASVAAAMGWDVSALSDSARQALLSGGAIKGPRAASVKPSMLQDVLAGRMIEAEALIGQVRAFAGDAGVATPVLDNVLCLLRGLARSTDTSS